MSKEHHYTLQVTWTGNQGKGTENYRVYQRSHIIAVPQKQDILASSDPAFRGDPTRHNPEELLLASLSGCHMLWYLHLCAEGGVVVLEYVDHPMGTMIETKDGGGRFSEVTLCPLVTVADASMLEQADKLHEQANALCFIANSVNFPVLHKVSSMVAVP